MSLRVRDLQRVYPNDPVFSYAAHVFNPTRQTPFFKSQKSGKRNPASILKELDAKKSGPDDSRARATVQRLTDALSLRSPAPSFYWQGRALEYFWWAWRLPMANDSSKSDSTIEQGGSGILEKGRPDGVGKCSDDQPILPSRQAVNIPTNFPRRKKK
jgi:hypothetical protein